MSAEDILTQFKSKVNEAIALVSQIPVEQKTEVWNFWELVTITVKLFTQVYIEENVPKASGRKTEAIKENADKVRENCLHEEKTLNTTENCDIEINDRKDPLEESVSENEHDHDDDKESAKRHDREESAERHDGEESAESDIRLIEFSESSPILTDDNNSLKDVPTSKPDPSHLSSSPSIVEIPENKQNSKSVNLGKEHSKSESTKDRVKENIVCVEIIKTETKSLEENVIPKLKLRKTRNENDDVSLNEQAYVTTNSPDDTKKVRSRKSSRPRKRLQHEEYTYEATTNEKKGQVSRNKNGDFTCKECGKKLSNATALKVHSRQHTGQRPFTCEICGRTFSTNGNKIRHEKSHKGEKNFQCEECQKWFSSAKNLQVHKRVHTGEKPYVCKVCDKRFTQQGSLTAHMDLHNGVKKYLCTVCGRSFTQKTNLEMHSLRHNKNNRQYKCQHCQYSFFTKGELSRHSVKHTKERPFLCNYCPKTFTRASYLKEHTNIHVMPKPYSCHKCGETFPELSLLRKHNKWHKVKELQEKKEEMTYEQVQLLENDENQRTCIVTTSEITGMKQIIMAADKDIPANVLQQFLDTGLVGDEPAEVTHVVPVAVDTEGNITQVDSADDGSQNIYEVTFLDANSDSEHSNIIATVDFSAMNLLANATTQKFS